MRHKKRNAAPSEPTLRVGDVVAPLEPTDPRKGGRVVATFALSDGDWPVVIWRADGGDRFDFATADHLQLIDRPARQAGDPNHLLIASALEHRDYQRQEDNEFAPATLETKRESLRRIEIARVLLHRAWEIVWRPFDDPDLTGWGWTDDHAASWYLTHAEHAEKMLAALQESTICAITAEENDADLRKAVTP